MKCKNCIKWLYPYKDYNGIYGFCTKHTKYFNENYNCVIKKKKEGKL